MAEEKSLDEIAQYIFRYDYVTGRRITREDLEVFKKGEEAALLSVLHRVNKNIYTP